VPHQINLYNPAFEEQRALLSFKAAAIGWGAIAVLIVVWAVYERTGLQDVVRQNQDLTAQISAGQAEAQSLAGRLAGRKQNLEVTAEISRLEKEILGRQDVMAVLQSGRLGDTKGFSEHFKAFARQSFEGVWLTGLQIGAGGRDMVMEGRALQADQVPRYLKRLNAETAMQGHPFSELMIQLPKAEEGAKAAKPWYVEFRLATKPGAPASPKASAQ
jgi:hypothetical protein